MDKISRDKLLSAQVGVLGSMLIDDRTVGPVLQEIKAEYFTAAEYRTIFQAIRRLFQAGKPIDPVIVLGAVGDEYRDLLADIIQVTPTAANVKFYIADLKRQARLQLIRDAAADIAEADNEDAVRELLDRINAVLVDRPGVRSMDMTQALADFYKRHDPETKPDYLPWKFPSLNDLLRTQRGDLGILGGYPSDGKTTLALTTAMEQAKSKRVGFFSFETSCAKLTDALICAAAQIGLPKIQLNALNQNDWDALAAISGRFTGHNLELIEAAGMTAADIRLYSMARHYDVIYIDYLQLIKAEGKSEWAQQDFNRVSANSLALKQFGREGGPTIIALSQMSRPQPTKQGKIPPPSMSNLRSSGQIEQDADFILLLFREDQTLPDSNRIVTVAKNKTGMAGNSFFLRFDGKMQTFREGKQTLPQPKQSTDQRLAQIGFYDTSDIPF